jgi:CRISPR-associated endonuclease/helicase Cas3
MLAFAEGRFRSIHPFRDFNGRVVRLFLLELLRRSDLPQVELAFGVENSERQKAYFSALAFADARDYAPLIEIWRQRFQEV